MFPWDSIRITYGGVCQSLAQFTAASLISFMVAPCLVPLQKLGDWSGFQVASNRSYRTLSYLFMIFTSAFPHILN